LRSRGEPIDRTVWKSYGVTEQQLLSKVKHSGSVRGLLAAMQR
jgi:hypothetical protein